MVNNSFQFRNASDCMWGVYLLSEFLRSRPPTPKQTVEAHAYNKLYGLRPDLDHVGLPGVASYEGHGSLSDSTESLPLPPSLPCHARHKEVGGQWTQLRFEILS